MHEIETAELYLIGVCILHDLDRIKVLENLSADDYMTENAQICHKLIEKLHNLGSPISFMIVAQESNKEHPERFRDLVVWLEHAVLISHGVDAEYYIDIVKNSSICRKTIKTITEASIQLKSSDPNIRYILDDTMQKLNNLTINKRIGHHHLKELFDSFQENKSYVDYITDIAARRAAGEDIFPGLRTGYNNLDSIIGGFKKGSYNVIGARSTSGKTTLMINFMRNIAQKYPNARQVFFTLEMPPTQIVHKLIGAYCSLNPKHIEQGRLNQEEIARIIEMEKTIRNMDLVLDGSIPANTSHIRSLTQRLAYEKKADILYIDYLTRLRSINKYQNKHLEIDEISKSLQDIALTLNIPVVCLCQLNRQVMMRTHKEPVLSDIRESGSIEEDADVVMLIHRPKLYDASLANDTTQIHVAKNRQYGDLGKTHLSFNQGILTELPKLEELIPANVIQDHKPQRGIYYE